MRRLVFVILVSSLLLSLTFIHKVNIPVVKASSSIYQGDLVLTGNNVTTIEDRRFDINGSIIVEENATLILRNTILNFAQARDAQFNLTFRNPANGNPRLIVENATIASNEYRLFIWFYGNSSASINKLTGSMITLCMGDSSVASISNSKVHIVLIAGYSVVNLSNSSVTYKAETYDDSSLNIFNCTISSLYAQGQSSVDVSNSTISSKIEVVAYSVNCSVAGLKLGFVSYWNFEQNCSVVFAPTGKATEVTLEDTHVGGWGFDFRGSSNATISNSRLRTIWAVDFAVVSVYDSSFSFIVWSYRSSRMHMYNSTADEIRSFENSKLWLVNSTSKTYEINDQSEVYVSWYLDVHVIDSEGTDVPSANVTATYLNGTVAFSQLADVNGWARLTLMEKMMNNTGSYPVGNHTVTATYETHTDQESVNMAGNQEITIALPFIIPEFPSFIILPLFMITTLLAVIVYRRKHY